MLIILLIRCLKVNFGKSYLTFYVIYLVVHDPFANKIPENQNS